MRFTADAQARYEALPPLVRERAEHIPLWGDEIARYARGEVTLADAYRRLRAAWGDGGGDPHNGLWIETPDGPRPRIPLTQAETRRMFLLPHWLRFAARRCPTARALLAPYVRGRVTLGEALDAWRSELLADGVAPDPWPDDDAGRAEVIAAMTERCAAPRWVGASPISRPGVRGAR